MYDREQLGRWSNVLERGLPGLKISEKLREDAIGGQ